MKKLLIFLLVLALLLAGLFFYKGGHHAIVLAQALEAWLDEDCADQSLTIQYQTPLFSADEPGSVTPNAQQLTLCTDSFWTEYHDRRIFGVTSQGVAAYTDLENLYLDSGRAYSLAELSDVKQSMRKLAAGLILHGRVTRHGDTCELRMETNEVKLNADFTIEKTLRAASITVALPDESSLILSLTATPTVSHPIPTEVTDAMVRAKMEPPMPLTEPLEVLLPALETLFPLEGDLSLSLECGILSLSETMVLRLSEEKAELERRGVTVELASGEVISRVEPAALALLLLRNGTFSTEGDAAVFHLEFPPETTDRLCAALLPQISELGIGFGESQAEVTIRNGTLSNVTMTAEGQVSFAIVTIPVSYRAELQISQ